MHVSRSLSAAQRSRLLARVAGAGRRARPPEASEIDGRPARSAKGRHLTADDTIQDLLNHPAFAGFARLLLPWDDRTYEKGMRLRDVGSLLPYHSHVDPGDCGRRVEST